MLKVAAMEQAAGLLRLTRALNLQGYGQTDRDLAAAAVALAAALDGQESGPIAAALDGLGGAYARGQEETGLSGFGRVAGQAAALALMFAAFDADGRARKGRRRDRRA